MKKTIWSCKIGEVDDELVPIGADLPMRQAVAKAYQDITGRAPEFIFSGWGAKLNDIEREVIDAAMEAK